MVANNREGCSEAGPSLQKTLEKIEEESPTYNIGSPLAVFGIAGSPSSVSPQSVRKTRPRSGLPVSRSDSLCESKVLLVNELRRSDSVMHPELFQYHNHFEFLELIGKTKTSEVYRVRHRQTGETFAVKRSRRRFRTKLQRERCLREIRTVAALPHHDNIVGQYRAWQEAGHFYIQMDLCSGGNLQQRIHSPDATAFSEEEIWRVAADVSSGLAFLHSQNILHLDIKPENIYLDTKGCWRIGDFGLAIGKEAKDWQEGDGGYVAPELLNPHCEPRSSADIFSLGATLYECARGQKLPREDTSPNAAEVKLPGRSESLLSMLDAMLRTNPFSRPSAENIVSYVKAVKESQGILNDGTGLPSVSPLSVAGDLTPAAAAGLLGLTPTEDGSDKKKEIPRPEVQEPLTKDDIFCIRTRDLDSSRVQEEGDPPVVGALELEFPDLLSPPSARKPNGNPPHRFGSWSLSWDFNTSPEILGHGASQEGSQNSESKRVTQVLQFPHLDEKENGGRVVASRKPIQSSPFECLAESKSEAQCSPIPRLPLQSSRLGKTVPRKRRLSSRRALVHALHDGKSLSSLPSDGSCLVERSMPVSKEAKHSGSFQLNVGDKLPSPTEKTDELRCPVAEYMNSMTLDDNTVDYIDRKRT